MSTTEDQLLARSNVKHITWAKLSVKHPIKTCLIILLIPIVAVALIVVTGSLQLDDPDGGDYFIRNDIRTRLDDARSAALEEYEFELNTTQKGERTEADSGYDITILIRSRIGEDGPIARPDRNEKAFNVLSPESLSVLKKAEDIVLNDPKYETFCLSDPDLKDCQGETPTCVPISSVTNNKFLYGNTAENGKLCSRKNTSDLVSQENFDRFVDSLFDTKDGQKVLKPEYTVLFGNDFNSTDKRSWILQSRIKIGFPFKGFRADNKDDEEKQDTEYQEWVEKLHDKVSSETSSKYDPYLLSPFYVDSQFADLAIGDLGLSIIAFILVFVVIWFHTTSAYLSGTAMAQIFLSFPLAYVVYYFVFRQLYFAALQMLAIFLLLGIGADDVFVFTDAWKQAAVVLGPDCDLITRMSWTYRRAVKAMTITSATTAAAFFVNATSPITPISTLGIWAGLLIILQYVLVITVYPCAIVIWEKFWSKRLFIRGFRRPREGQEAELTRPFWHRFIPSKWRPKHDPNSNEYRVIERFFRGPWLNIVRKIRFLLIIVAVAVLSVSIYLATRLEPIDEAEKFLPDSNPLARAIDDLQNAFPRSEADSLLRVRLTWGIKDIDRSGTSRFEPEELGKVVLDESFDFRKKEVQQRVLDACSFFGNQKDLLFDGPVIDPINCWIRDYKKWREEKLNKTDFENFNTSSVQVEELIEFAEFSENDTQPYLKYLTGQHFAFNEDRNRVVFTEVRFVSNLDESDTSQKVMRDAYNKWQLLVQQFNSESPDGAQNMIATGGFSWKWELTQRILLSSMYTGIGIMIAVSLVVLSIATMNLVMAFLTTVVIGGVAVSLLAFIYLLGWDLGFTETVAVVISVGYSFDGAAHIAVAYMESKSDSRVDRTQSALTDLGISIIFGALTTIISAAALLPAVITFFVKFAILIIITIVSSMIWSLLFFPAILIVLGPVGKFGSLMPLVRPFKKLFSRKSSKQATKVEEQRPDLENHANVTNV